MIELQTDENSDLKKAIYRLLDDNDSDKLIINSLSCINLSARRFKLLLILFIGLILILFHSFDQSSNALSFTFSLLNLVNSIAVPTLALAVTGFSIFQALVNGDTLITLLKVDSGESSKFQKYNYFFLAFSLLFLSIIIFNFILEVLIFNLDDGWSISLFSNKVNTIFFTIGVSLYVTFFINALIEIKSFIYNLYQVFSINAVSKGIAYLNEHDNTD